jgi:hypothetical protein
MGKKGGRKRKERKETQVAPAERKACCTCQLGHEQGQTPLAEEGGQWFYFILFVLQLLQLKPD